MKIEEGFLGQLMLVLPPLKRQMAAEHSFSRSLYPTAIGYYPLASYHERERPTGSEDHILIYCVDGHGYVEENGERVELAPNNFYILSPNIPHRYGSTPKKPWSIYWVHYNGEQAKALYDRYCLNRTNGHNGLIYDKARISMFNSVLNNMQKDLDDQVLELLYIQLLQYISSFIHVYDQYDTDEDDAISRSLSYMKKNIKGDLGLKEFAGVANYSVTRFSQLFRERTGYAPVQYFLQLKIRSACQYLSFTNMSIKEISEVLGSDDAFYFSRIFKKLTGMSPSAYRKLNSGLIANTTEIKPT